MIGVTLKFDTYESFQDNLHAYLLGNKSQQYHFSFLFNGLYHIHRLIM